MAVQWITRRVLAVLAVVAALGKIPYAESKSVQGVFLLEAGDFDTGPEYEITKFTFTTGKGKEECCECWIRFAFSVEGKRRE